MKQTPAMRNDSNDAPENTPRPCDDQLGISRALTTLGATTKITPMQKTATAYASSPI